MTDEGVTTILLYEQRYIPNKTSFAFPCQNVYFFADSSSLCFVWFHTRQASLTTFLSSSKVSFSTASEIPKNALWKPSSPCRISWSHVSTSTPGQSVRYHHMNLVPHPPTSDLSPTGSFGSRIWTMNGSPLTPRKMVVPSFWGSTALILRPHSDCVAVCSVAAGKPASRGAGTVQRASRSMAAISRPRRPVSSQDSRSAASARDSSMFRRPFGRNHSCVGGKQISATFWLRGSNSTLPADSVYADAGRVIVWYREAAILYSLRLPGRFRAGVRRPFAVHTRVLWWAGCCLPLPCTSPRLCITTCREGGTHTTSRHTKYAACSLPTGTHPFLGPLSLYSITCRMCSEGDASGHALACLAPPFGARRESYINTQGTDRTDVTTASISCSSFYSTV